MNYEVLLNLGELGICGLWSYWKALWLIFESVIHDYEFCIFLKTTVGILCSLYNEYFIFRCGSPTQGACGKVGNELYLAQITSAKESTDIQRIPRVTTI